MRLFSSLSSLALSYAVGVLGSGWAFCVGSLHGASPGVTALVLPGGKDAPVLDGVLDDACWKIAAAVTDFRQVYPIEGGAPSEATEVCFAYDAKHLYVAIRCYDREPQRVTARELQRDSFGDESFPTDDLVQVVLDPFGRQRDGFIFAVNPLGVMTDGRIEQGSTTVVEWDGLWDARAKIDEQGWAAELKIPFSSLSFDPKKTQWGVNLQRVIRRREEVIRWAQPSQSKEGDSLQDIAKLDALQALDQGLGIEVKPYISTRYIDEKAGDDGGTDIRAGFDASWLITPALNATLTVNTDFAEAEVDDRQINLGRFPLFFPEKRDFFLRDAPYFGSPANTNLLMPFFSRNIGRSEDGKPVDILVGGKFTGRAGPYTIGILDVQQRGYDGVDDKNLLAARVTRELSEDLTLGMMLTNGDPYSNGSNTVLGADLSWETDTLLGDKNFIAQVWGLGSQSTGLADDYAFGARAHYVNLPWEVYMTVSQIGDEFQPGLGFLSRRGVREYSADVVYQIPINQHGLRHIRVAAFPYVVTTLEGEVESAEHTLPAIAFVWGSGDEISLDVIHHQEQLFEPFEIHEGNVIPVGNYHFSAVQLEFTGAPSRVVVPSGGVKMGDFYEGSELSWWLGMDWRPSPHLNLGIDYQQYGVDLPSGDFTTHLCSAHVKVAFGPRLSWNNLVQYDNESDTVGFNSRVRWTIKPGTDVYLILNQGYVVETNRRLTYVGSDASIKAGVTWRF